MSEDYSNASATTLMAGTLRLVNAFRHRTGRKTLKKLPKGMNSARACPLYNAIDASCTAVKSNALAFSRATDAIQAATAWGTSVEISDESDEVIRVYNFGGKYIVTCPTIFREFIKRFDSRRIPSLIKK